MSAISLYNSSVSLRRTNKVSRAVSRFVRDVFVFKTAEERAQEIHAAISRGTTFQYEPLSAMSLIRTFFVGCAQGFLISNLALFALAGIVKLGTTLFRK